MPAINCRELKRMTEAHGATAVGQHIREALETKLLRIEDMPTMYEIFCETVDDGYRRWAAMENRKSGGMSLQEAIGAVDTSAFTNIFGQIVYSRMKESYEGPQLVWPKLFDQQQTTFLNGEKIPGVGGLGDIAQAIGEGKDYPVVGVNEEYVETAALVKRGFTVPVTRETMIADRTGGMVLKRCGAASEALGINAEKRAVDVVVGTTNNYKRNGTATNTYLSSGAYTNTKASNALVSWENLNAALLTLLALTDPNTGEPINASLDALIIPPALLGTALRIKSALSVEHVDNQANAATIRTLSGNPISGLSAIGMGSLEIICNQYIKNRTSSDSTYFVGSPKKAFCRFYAWDFETPSFGSGTNDDIKRDIAIQFKGSVMDNFQVLEPRFMCKVTG
jgi:hypothetical protein